MTHVFVAGDKYLDSDVVFGVKDSLIREFVRCPAGRAPDGRTMTDEYYHLNYDFGLKQISLTFGELRQRSIPSAAGFIRADSSCDDPIGTHQLTTAGL